MNPSVGAALIVSAIGILITFYYSNHSKNIAYDKKLKELFTEFNKRYEQLNDSLFLIANKYPTTEKLNAAPEVQNLKLALLDYFNLCAEEFFWYYHKKRIDELIWKSWQSGMLEWFKVPAIRDFWMEEIKASGKASYYITDEREFFIRT